VLADKADPGAESLRNFLHQRERRAGLIEETLVVEVVQWGRLRDKLESQGLPVTAAAYAREHQTSVEDAELRWAQFLRVVGRDPVQVADIQWEAANRYDPGDLLDEVYIKSSL
jgi:hypothetical protein